MYNLKCSTEAIKKAVEICGSPKNLALKIGASYQSVLNWRAGKNNPNTFYCIKIEEATERKITRKDIFPSHPWDEPTLETKES